MEFTGDAPDLWLSMWNIIFLHLLRPKNYLALDSARIEHSIYIIVQQEAKYARLETGSPQS